MSQNNLCSSCSDLRQICSKNSEEYRDIVRNFLGKDGVKMSAKCVNYFVTVTNYKYSVTLLFMTL
jgi:hypothetical protein